MDHALFVRIMQRFGGAVETLEGLGVPCETRVVSAHRTPDLLMEYAEEARGRGLEVIVAGAMGLRCFGVSCLTNFAAGISPEPLSHAEVMETTERVGGQFRGLVRSVVARIEARL